MNKYKLALNLYRDVEKKIEKISHGETISDEFINSLPSGQRRRFVNLTCRSMHLHDFLTRAVESVQDAMLSVCLIEKETQKGRHRDLRQNPYLIIWGMYCLQKWYKTNNEEEKAQVVIDQICQYPLAWSTGNCSEGRPWLTGKWDFDEILDEALKFHQNPTWLMQEFAFPDDPYAIEMLDGEDNDTIMPFPLTDKEALELAHRGIGRDFQWFEDCILEWLEDPTTDITNCYWKLRDLMGVPAE